MLVETLSPRFVTTHVGQLHAALKSLGDDNCDLLLLDLSLPDAQGLDTFTRAQRHAPQVPIILLTGLEDQELAVEAVRQGAQDHLVKGQFDGRLLVTAVRYAIERKQIWDMLDRQVQARTKELANANAELKVEIS